MLVVGCWLLVDGCRLSVVGIDAHTMRCDLDLPASGGCIIVDLYGVNCSGNVIGCVGNMSREGADGWSG